MVDVWGDVLPTPHDPTPAVEIVNIYMNKIQFYLKAMTTITRKEIDNNEQFWLETLK